MLRIKFLRISAGRSQWHIAQAARMSQGRYSMLERGLIEPTDEKSTSGLRRSSMYRLLGCFALRFVRDDNQKDKS